MNAPVILDRRRVLAGGGALIVNFSLTPALAEDAVAPPPPPAPKPPGSLANAPFLDLGFASMPTARSRCSPARPNSARVSRPRRR